MLFAICYLLFAVCCLQRKLQQTSATEEKSLRNCGKQNFVSLSIRRTNKTLLEMQATHAKLAQTKLLSLLYYCNCKLFIFIYFEFYFCALSNCRFLNSRTQLSQTQLNSIRLSEATQQTRITRFCRLQQSEFYILFQFHFWFCFLCRFSRSCNSRVESSKHECGKLDKQTLLAAQQLSCELQLQLRLGTQTCA